MRVPEYLCWAWTSICFPCHKIPTGKLTRRHIPGEAALGLSCAACFEAMASVFAIAGDIINEPANSI